jgi:hypothetical protein
MHPKCLQLSITWCLDRSKYCTQWCLMCISEIMLPVLTHRHHPSTENSTFFIKKKQVPYTHHPNYPETEASGSNMLPAGQEEAESRTRLPPAAPGRSPPTKSRNSQDLPSRHCAPQQFLSPPPRAKKHWTATIGPDHPMAASCPLWALTPLPPSRSMRLPILPRPEDVPARRRLQVIPALRHSLDSAFQFDPLSGRPGVEWRLRWSWWAVGSVGRLIEGLLCFSDGLSWGIPCFRSVGIILVSW